MSAISNTKGFVYGFSGVILIAFIMQFNALRLPEMRHVISKTVETPSFLKAGEKWSDSIIAQLSLEKKIAQFFMVAAWTSDSKENRAEVENWITSKGIGGIIFFQGDTRQQKEFVKRYQSLSEIPLLIGMDAEWGPAMRMTDSERYPYQLTMGATGNDSLIRQAGYWIGRECADLGVHINFAPVVDVNVNPQNPVISYRSFGENPRDVAKFSLAFSQGMESSGVMACVKHFPGHGDTDKDSHLELPTVNHTQTQFQAVDFVPFYRTIDEGVSAVMVAHLNVPSLDSSGTPSSLSAKVIKNWLQDSLGFKGLVISDALNMKGVANHYGKTEVVVKAFMAGNDILLFPESVDEAIDAIAQAVKSNRISEKEINQRCKKVLQAKFHAIQQQKKVTQITAKERGQIELLKREIIKQAITVAKNNDGILPILDMRPKTAIVILGNEGHLVENRLLDYIGADVFYFQTGMEPLGLLHKLTTYERIISVCVAETNRPIVNYGYPDGWETYVRNMDEGKIQIGLFLGNPYALVSPLKLDKFDAVVIGYENSRYTQDIIAQVVMGAYGAQGSLPITIQPTFKRDQSIATLGEFKLQFTIPEELGISRAHLAKIDSLAQYGIAQGAYPGCQVVAAKDGKVFYRKNFGHHTYDKSQPVTDRTVYDLASITKIAASTLALMRMAGEQQFHLDSTLSCYLPEIVSGTAYANLTMRDILTHQAGLSPWIPFYTKTLLSGQWIQEIYSTTPKTGFSTQVADNLYILDSYHDSIFKRILETPIKKGQGYKYSDVGYYFIKEIIRKQTGMTIDQYVTTYFYEPMGLSTMCFNPLTNYGKNRIAPTENDKIFRKQLIHGHVHDQGSAMMGGVGGHAGLFANAIDLTALMQMMLNKGKYGGDTYLNDQVVTQYTKCQHCGTNRRAIGFDKPVRNLAGGPTCELVSLDSYGHTGFTGTMTWVDPKNGINYVFLSNRVYPDAENKKLLSLSTRTEIQRIIYEALKKTN